MTNPVFIKSQIEKEDAVFEYRSKLRTTQCQNHVSNLRSECAKCRSMFWSDCLKQTKEEAKKEPIRNGVGIVNRIKSEAGTRRSIGK